MQYYQAANLEAKREELKRFQRTDVYEVVPRSQMEEDPEAAEEVHRLTNTSYVKTFDTLKSYFHEQKVS